MLRFGLAFLGFALAVASAKSYDVKVYEPLVVAGTAVQAGECRVDVNGDAMKMKCGKVAVETPVKIEQAEQKYRTNTVKYEPINGKNHVREIRLGGTNIKLVFEPSVAETAENR